MKRRSAGVAAGLLIVLTASGTAALTEELAGQIPPAPAMAAREGGAGQVGPGERGILVSDGRESADAPAPVSTAADLEASRNARRAVTYMLWLLIGACVSTVWIIFGDDRRRSR